MIPGRALDEAVFYKVMGAELVSESPKLWKLWNDNPIKVIPAYSVSIGDAWKVVERMHGNQAKLELVPAPVGYQASFVLYNSQREFALWEEFDGTEAVEKTAPHAICIAAIQAMERMKNKVDESPSV